MARTRVGLDVGSSAVRGAELSVSSDPPALVRVGQVPLDQGVVVHGEVRQPEALTEAIRELWRRAGFGAKQAVMGVGNQRVVVREVAVAALPEKELRASLPYQVQEFIPLPVEEAVLDYEVVDEFQDDDGRRMVRLLLVAAQRDMVSALVGSALEARVEPTAVDLVPFALVRSIGTSAGMGIDVDQGSEAVVDIGADITNICVHDHGRPRFVRILPSGGNDITVAVGRALGVDDQVAEQAKRGNGEPGGPPPEDVERIASSRAATFVDEIRSSLDFFLTQTPGTRIQRVAVSGGGSKLPGLMGLFESRMSAEVVEGHAFSRVSPRLQMNEEELREAERVLAVAVGLALPPEDR